jgi:nicotinamidase-related amidase
MTTHVDIDPAVTALLTLDLQVGILGLVPGADIVMHNAARAVAAARRKQMRIIHVGLGFAEGHPEIPDTQLRFRRIKDANSFVKGTASATFHPAVAQPDDLRVYKQRVSAFSENELHLILRSLGVSTLVLFGVATSGITLSTLRRAFDLDYRSIVIRDACFDADPEIHRVLTEKIFPTQATVLSTDDFVAALL